MDARLGFQQFSSVRQDTFYLGHHEKCGDYAGIEVAHMIRKKQFQTNHTSPFKQFARLAA